jgi:hypothetical protein
MELNVKPESPFDHLVRVSELAQKYMALYESVRPDMEVLNRTGVADQETLAKIKIAIRGMEHFMPFVEKFAELMKIAKETPLELVDPDVLSFLDGV